MTRRITSSCSGWSSASTYLHPSCLKDGLFVITAARTIARCGYRGDYAEVERLFEMKRPQVG